MRSGVVRGDHQKIATGVADDQLRVERMEQMRYEKINLEMSLQYPESGRCRHVQLWTCDSPFAQIADYFTPATALASVGVQGDNHLG